MTTFLDVGSHEGQTLEAVVGRFDLIYAFEPMPAQFEVLTQRFGSAPGVHLFNYGLADFTGDQPLYGNNDGMEASLYADKRDADSSVVTSAKFVSASEWFREHIADDEDVVMKLNCEGCEVVVMNDLLESGEVWKIRNVMIDFDVRKIPSMASEERALLKRMSANVFDRFSMCEEVMQGATHQDRIINWLDGLE